jgi:HlyD family secretion protein
VIRNAPITVQNVVSYDVVIRVDNSGLKLKPGMTANVSIIIAVKDGILRIPNAALRYTPSGKGSAGPGKRAQGQSVWIIENKKPKRLQIKTGISDGNYTEIISGPLREGDAVIVTSTDNEKKGGSSRGRGFFR